MSLTHPEVSKTPGKRPDLIIEEGKTYGVDSPERITDWRHQLFSPCGIILLNDEQFNTYWPYVSNVWSKDTTRERKKDGHQVTYYDCRLRRRKEPLKENLVTKSKSKRERDQCHGACRVDYDPATQSYRISLSNPHSHNLETSDKDKLNNGLRFKIERVILANPAAGAAEMMANIIKDGRKDLDDAGGKHLDSKNIHNWSRKFRQNDSPAQHPQSDGILSRAQSFAQGPQSNGFPAHNHTTIQPLQPIGFPSNVQSPAQTPNFVGTPSHPPPTAIHPQNSRISSHVHASQT